MSARKKVTIVGAGMTGGAIAQRLVLPHPRPLSLGEGEGCPDLSGRGEGANQHKEEPS